MADTTKKIAVEISAKVNDAAKKIDNVSDSITKLKGNAKNLSAGMDVAAVATGAFIGSLATDAIEAFGQMLSSAVTAVINFGTQTQKTMSTLSAMKNLTGEASEAFQAFNDVGRNTNYDLQAVQEMGIQLVNLGYSAQNAADLIQLCADTAAGLGQGQAGAQQLVDAISRIQATGEMSSRQLITLAQSGMDLDKAFSTVGMTAAQAMKAMEDGTLDSKVAVQALTNYMHEFDGSMAESKRNITDMWGDVSGNVQTALGEIGASIFDAFNQSGIIQTLIDFTQDLVDLVRSDGTGAFSDLGDIASDVLDGINTLLNVVVTALKFIIITVGDVYSAFKRFGSQVYSALQPAIDALMTVYNVVTKILSSIGAGFASKVNAGYKQMIDSGLEPEERAERRRAARQNNFRTATRRRLSSGGGGSAGGGGGGASKAVSEEERAIEALIKKYSDADKMLKNVIKSEIEAAKIGVSMMSGKAKLTEENTIKLTALKTAHDEVLNGYEKELAIAKNISDSATKDNVISGINKQIEAENKLYQAKLKYAAFEADRNARNEETAAFDREMQHIQNLMNMYQISADKRIEMENNVLEARRMQLENTLTMLEPYSEEWIKSEQQLADTIQQIHANAAYNVRGGWQEALRGIANQQINFKDAFTSIFDSINTGFVNLVAGAGSAKDKLKNFFNDITNTILQSITKIIIQGLIAKAIMSAIGVTTKEPSWNNFAKIPAVIKPPTAATGGLISGPGTGTSDSIPAMLSNGEYIIKAAAVRRIGVPNLNALNRGVPHFANGGYVGRNGAGNGAPPVVINLHNESGVAMDAQQTDATFDGESWVIGIVLNGIATNKNGMRSVLKGAMANG